MKERTASSRKGAVLLMVLVVLTVVAVLGSSLLVLGAMDTTETAREVGETQAFWAAESGLSLVRAIANSHREPFDRFGYWGTNAFSGTIGPVSYQVDVLDEPGWSNNGQIKKYKIVSRGIMPGGATQRVELNASIETFATYMHASNFERTSSGTRIVFITGDVLDGPVYCNDEINLYGLPRFLDTVRSAADHVNYTSGASDASFEKDLILNVAPLDFNQYSDHVANLQAKAAYDGVSLSGNYTLRFYDNGTVTHQRTTGGPIVTNRISDFNGVIHVDGDVRIKPPQGKSASVVNGNVTIASSRRVYLDGNVTYESAAGCNVFADNFDPRGVLNDSLGIVSQNGVWISGNKEITIHAAILVTTGNDGLSATYRYESIGSKNINLYGSLGQYRRGIVGRADGKGFRKNYRYDRRFLDEPPVEFPYSVYRFSEWKQGA